MNFADVCYMDKGFHMDGDDAFLNCASRVTYGHYNAESVSELR